MFRTLTSLALAASVAAASNATERLGESAGTPGVNTSYDYIVVGGGTGGLAIAARLAEEKDSTVAVIEAGGFYQQDNGNGRCVNLLPEFMIASNSLQCHPWPLWPTRNRCRPTEVITSD